MNYYQEEREVKRDKLTEGHRLKLQKTVREDGTALIVTPDAVGQTCFSTKEFD